MEDFIKELNEIISCSTEYTVYIKGDTKSIYPSDVIEAIFQKDPNITNNLFGITKNRKKFKVSAKDQATIDKLISIKTLKIKNVDLQIQGPLPQGDRYRFNNIPPQLTDELLQKLLNSFGQVLHSERDKTRGLNTGRVFVIFSPGSITTEFSKLSKIKLGTYEISVHKIESKQIQPTEKTTDCNHATEEKMVDNNTQTDINKTQNAQEDESSESSSEGGADQDSESDNEESEESKTSPINNHTISLRDFNNAKTHRTSCRIGRGISGKDDIDWLSLILPTAWTDIDHSSIMQLLTATEWNRGTKYSYFKLPKDSKFRYCNYLTLYYV